PPRAAPCSPPPPRPAPPARPRRRPPARHRPHRRVPFPQPCPYSAREAPLVPPHRPPSPGSSPEVTPLERGGMVVGDGTRRRRRRGPCERGPGRAVRKVPGCGTPPGRTPPATLRTRLTSPGAGGATDENGRAGPGGPAQQEAE